MNYPRALIYTYALFSVAVLWTGFSNISGIQPQALSSYQTWRSRVETRLEKRIERLQQNLIEPENPTSLPQENEPIRISLTLYNTRTPYQYVYTLRPPVKLPAIESGTERTKSLRKLHQAVKEELEHIKRIQRLVDLIAEGPYFDQEDSEDVRYTLHIQDGDYQFERSFSQSTMQREPEVLLLATLLSQYAEASPLHPTLAQNKNTE